MSVQPLDLVNQTTLVPNNLLGYSSDQDSAIQITPTEITIAGNLNTTPIYVGISSSTGLTTNRFGGLNVNCGLEMNYNDIIEVGTISRYDGNNLNIQTNGGGNILISNQIGAYANIDTFNVNTSSPLTVSDGSFINTITGVGYTTRNSVVNATQFLTFVESSATGNSALRKVAGITCNPSTSQINCSNLVTTTLNAPLITCTSGIQLPTNNSVATFAGTTLTISSTTSNSFRNFIYSFTGTTNTIATISFSFVSTNSIMYISLYNGGTGNLTINSTGLGANIKTAFTSNVIVPTLSYVILTVNYLTLPTAGLTYVLSANLIA